MIIYQTQNQAPKGPFCLFVFLLSRLAEQHCKWYCSNSVHLVLIVRSCIICIFSWLHMQCDGLSQFTCGCVCNAMFYFTDGQIRLGNKLLVYIRYVCTLLPVCVYSTSSLYVLYFQVCMYSTSRFVCTLLPVCMYSTSRFVCTLLPGLCVLYFHVCMYSTSRFVCTLLPGLYVLYFQVCVYSTSSLYVLYFQVCMYSTSRFVCTLLPGLYVLYFQFVCTLLPGLYVLYFQVCMASSSVYTDVYIHTPCNEVFFFFFFLGGESVCWNNCAHLSVCLLVTSGFV